MGLFVAAGHLPSLVVAVAVGPSGDSPAMSSVMLVGIGFGSILIGAVAEQFVARDVGTEVEAVEATEEELLRELRELTARLGRIEGAMGRRTSRPS